MSKSIDVQVSGPNALRIENERQDVGTGGYSGVSNRSDDSHAKRVVSIFGPGFSKELPGAATLDIRSFNYDVSNPVLISQNAVK
jgi:hypothetical protein